jgi:hypothetical protein
MQGGSFARKEPLEHLNLLLVVHPVDSGILIADYASSKCAGNKLDPNGVKLPIPKFIFCIAYQSDRHHAGL